MNHSGQVDSARTFNRLLSGVQSFYHLQVTTQRISSSSSPQGQPSLQRAKDPLSQFDLALGVTYNYCEVKALLKSLAPSVRANTAFRAQAV